MTPDEFTNSEIMLEVSGGHSLYVQDWGNKDAEVPIIYLHGGPGDGCTDNDKRKFDPTTERVIFHDQRGSGKSIPLGSIENNQTTDLISDIEAIRRGIGLDKFVIVGGSWGSALALLYSIDHPDHVCGLVLDGVFTATSAEIDWFDGDGLRLFYPEIWQEYIKGVPSSERDHPTQYHFEQALGDDPERAKRSIYEYTSVLLARLKLDDMYTPGSYDKFDPSRTKIEIHYITNHHFIEDGYILNHADKLTMPVRIVQGRYDMVCPPKGAYDLSQKLSDVKLIWTISGHLRGHEAKNIQRLFISELLGSK